MINNIGKFSYGLDNIIIHDWGQGTKINVGSFCSIGSEVECFLGGNHRIDWITTYPFGHINKEIFNSFDGVGHPSTKGDITICNDVWIGMGSKIMSGIVINDGAVVAANSVVTKNVEPYTVVGGNPAKVLRKRFDDEIIKYLLELQWWNWDVEKINKNIKILCSNNVEELKKLK
jgi:acetyltransferase-like isoleucine patch superfamily enzyme